MIFKRILPTSITTELLDRHEITDYHSALAYCRRRTDFKKEQELQAHAQKKILGKTRMHAMRNEDTHNVVKPVNTKSDWRDEQVFAGEVHKMIAAMVKKKEQGARSTGGRDASRGRGCDKDKKNGSRGDSRDRAPRKRIVWNGSCFDCKGRDHKRDKCSAYAKLLENSHGKVPANYESAYNKAKKAWV